MRWLSAVLLFSVTACDPTDDAFDPNYCPKVAEWEPEWVALEDEVTSLVNERRSEGGVCGSQSFGPAQPLATDTALRCAARNHSLDMATRDFFNHVNPDGEDFSDRISRAGFSWSAIGENIARGQDSAADVMVGWMASPGHCANILEPRFEFLGVGYYEGNFWTQTFAAE